MSEEKKVVCKPGFNSCEVVGEEKKVEVKPVPETEKVCKPGFNSCEVPEKPINVEEEKEGVERHIGSDGLVEGLHLSLLAKTHLFRRNAKQERVLEGER